MTVLNRWSALGALTVASALSLSAQQPPPARIDPSLDRVMATVESVARLVENFDRVANAPVPARDLNAPPMALRNGSVKATITRATAGAATGAAVAALTNKGQNAVVVGAIMGAVAGIVYDRVKVEQEHRADLDAGYSR